MPKPPRTPHRATPPAGDRADPKFAREITRAEFGRFYWNDERAEEVKRANLNRKKPPRGE